MKARQSRCERCDSLNVEYVGASRNVAHCHDCKWCADDSRESLADQVQWAPGCDPEMYTDENGDYVAKNPMYSFWQPKDGETPTIRIIQSDNIVECIDNTGMEDQFDQGIEYIFEGAAYGDMITVFDKMGEKRECFASRFKVKSTEGNEFQKHLVPFKAWVDPLLDALDTMPEGDAITDAAKKLSAEILGK